MFRLYVRGVEFRLSLLFPALLVVLFTLDRSDFPVWCVAASLMHETGHLVAMVALGSRPAQITVGIFGVCVVQKPDSPLSPMGNIGVALAGPAVNLFSFFVLFAASGFRVWSVPVLVHLVLGLFNLLPIEPLDGGQALFYALSMKMEEKYAERVVLAVSAGVLVPLATGGFFLMLRSGYNITLLAVSIYLGLLLVLKQKSC